MLESTSWLLTVAAGAVLALLILITRFKIHAFVALTLVSVLTALAAGIPVGNVVTVMKVGLGSTLASVAMLVGLGVMIGTLLQVSGGASVLANRMVDVFGEQRAPLALGVASLLFGFPIFFDAGLIVMMPIIFSVATRLGGSIIVYGFPAAGAFAVMHALVPPHPGPVASAELLGANLGQLLFVGLAIGIPTWYIAAYLYSKYACKKFTIPTPSSLFGAAIHNSVAQPSFGMVLSLLLLPVLLISLNSVSHALVVTDIVSESVLINVLSLVGETPIALLITVMVCLVVFAKQFGWKRMESLCSDALGPICGVILVTGAGGMFGGVLRSSGIGEALASLLNNTGLPVIVAAFFVATCLRVAQGSATVALTTASAIMAPIVAVTPELTSVDLCCVVVAIAGGATVLSHFNDSGFWLVSRLFNMDEATTLKTWTVMETLIGTVAFLLAFAVSVVF
jgi:GntP family gluconate:H+ symporter